ncbi:hypothetical protein GCM10010307_05770 [Streptomyces vastus]|uniref:Uncharacterized protein n=1 Tax=Streptomyces vastus TaxID=285451 RepID=A0ABN3QBA6_9ACTN
MIGVGEQLEDTQSSVERLRGLRGHDAHSLVVRVDGPLRGGCVTGPNGDALQRPPVGKRPGDYPGGHRLRSAAALPRGVCVAGQ